MNLPERIFRRLAGGGQVSGESLARELGVSRSAVWKAIRQLRASGAGVTGVRHRGYALARPVTALASQTIEASIPDCWQPHVAALAVRWQVESTNTVLLGELPRQSQRASVLLAEIQTAGRGRQQRSWQSSLGGSLSLSIAWQFSSMPPMPGSLSLAIGIASRRALGTFGARDVMLKWPNDLQVRGAKLGGILLEMRAEAGGCAQVVIGIGINIALADAQRQALIDAGTRAADLAHDLGLIDVDRNQLAGRIIGEVICALLEFERAGFGGFATEWRGADALFGREVRVYNGDDVSVGKAMGVDDTGQLLLATADGATRALLSGDVSVRVQP
ncbi:MAG: biotin--[acetyl-CoA-carboxylase] ligase [Steroidobacteraceae bacterium]